MTDNEVVLSREQVLRYRWRAVGLDAAPEKVPLTSVAGLDLGIQDRANSAGVIGLVNRGAAVDDAIRVTSGFSEELALVWAVRGAPHFVRREDLPDMQLALSPFSEVDAIKRILLATYGES